MYWNVTWRLLTTDPQQHLQMMRIFILIIPILTFSFYTSHWRLAVDVSIKGCIIKKKKEKYVIDKILIWAKDSQGPNFWDIKKQIDFRLGNKNDPKCYGILTPCLLYMKIDNFLILSRIDYDSKIFSRLCPEVLMDGTPQVKGFLHFRKLISLSFPSYRLGRDNKGSSNKGKSFSYAQV